MVMSYMRAFMQLCMRRVRNHENTRAYGLTPEMELYATVSSTFINATYYEHPTERTVRIAELVSKCDPEFVARLAVYARTQMRLRTAPLLLVALLARYHSGSELVARVIDRVVLRADEIAQLLTWYTAVNGRIGRKQLGRLSKQVQHGLASAFNRFDAYQFAKYDRPSTITLRDALFLDHPRPKDEAQQAVFDQIARRTLPTPSTWEVALSAVGAAHYESKVARSEAFRST